MGRLPDDPADQAAKGYPGKRRRRIDVLIREAEARASLLVPKILEASSPSLAPPAYLAEPVMIEALTIWREKVAVLTERNLYNAALDRELLAAYCVYAAEFVLADREIRRDGYQRLVKTQSGDYMPRRHLAVDRRDVAFRMMAELSSRFGFTAADRQKIERYESQRELLPPMTQETPAVAAAPKDDDDAIGLLDQFDSPPPGARPN